MAVIGSGCSAIQVVPAIQPTVAPVDVYQRSLSWTFPKFDFAYRRRTQRLFARFPFLRRIDDPALRRTVTPHDEIGCKRILATDHWYQTLTTPNVAVVTDRIAGVTRSTDGTTLAEAWGDLPRAYLGITVPGFPNLFLLYGPNTNGAPARS